MRRMIFSATFVLLLACRLVTPAPQVTPSPTPALTSTATATPSPTPVSDHVRRLPPLPEGPFQVNLHPDGELVAGDQVSFEVIAPPGARLQGRSVTLHVEGEEEIFGPADFGRYGIAGRAQATLFWAWDTAGLPAGDYNLTYAIAPDGMQWTQTVTLLPQEALPEAEVGARWAHAESDCCLVYYITGTDAERDLPEILSMADEQAALVEGRFQHHLTDPVTLVLLPRVLGHGGFTGEGIAISYLDLRYSGSDPEIVLRHELVHYVDHLLGGDLRPTILVEGLAVYVSGGHFKEEPLLPRAAALLKMGDYLPLEPLADNFYPSQHESGYLEAGALVEYMVQRWGWEAFQGFYRDIHSNGDNQQEAIDRALGLHFGISFADLEAGFLDALRSQPEASKYDEDVRLTIAFYDTVRRYQQVLDPSAYYLAAWLPDGKQMRERGIVADYLRHPSAPINHILESLLVSADGHLRAGDYQATGIILQTVDRVLDVLGE